jgi:hypothetical protein
VAETTLEGLEAKFCCNGIVFALRRFDKLRTDKAL